MAQPPRHSPDERNHEDFDAFRQEVRDNMGKMQRQHEALMDAIGHASDDGKGGSGLLGEVMRLKSDVRGLLDLKTKGMGFIAAVGLAGAVIMVFLKEWITRALAGVPHS